MDRRTTIKSLGLISLHALYPSVLASFLSGCKNKDHVDKAFAFFTDSEGSLVKELIDILLPATKTKSASEVNVHYFLDDVFALCLNKDQQALIRTGFSALRKDWGMGDKIEKVRTLDAAAYKGAEEAAWFKTVKQYAMIGFFTSQEGTTRAGDYQKIPDRYIGEVHINESTLAHGRTNLKFNI